MTRSHLCWLGLGLVLLVGGCVTTETATFSPHEDQQAIVRDGIPALVSQGENSLLIARPAQRQQVPGQRQAYVIGILNFGETPADLRFDSVDVVQMHQGRPVRRLRTYSHDALVAEERRRQVAMAILTGLAAGANTAAAANAGHYSAQGTVMGPYGTSRLWVTGYDPTAAQIAQMRASMQNQAMVAQTIEAGRRNLDHLEAAILKDNTVFPGEWYGGQVQFDPPEGQGAKHFRISVAFGSDRHEIDVTHARSGG